MKNDIHFWMATLLRGALALVIGSAVMVIPDMSRTLLLMPFAVAFSILCLAAYGVLDSAIVFVTSFMVPSRAKVALRLQGSVGVVVGVVLFTVVYDQVRLHWFLYLIAFQALSAAVTEFIVARHASSRHASVWNYAAAAVALVFMVLYSLAAVFLGENLLPREAAWLIYGYLAGFGMAQCVTGGRMLYADYQAEEMLQTQAVDPIGG